MKTEDATPQQTLLMWRILAAATGTPGEVMQKDLGVDVAPGDRQRLVQLGLLEVGPGEKGKRGLKLRVTEDGWAWANENLGAKLPDKASARIAPLLQKWLTLFHGHLRRTGTSLADVFATQTPQSKPLGESASSHVIDMRARIRAAYLALTHGQLKARCLLRDLRSRLGDIERDRLDLEIGRMVASGEAILFRLDNRIEITPADAAAAIFAGGEQRHILWIDR